MKSIKISALITISLMFMVVGSTLYVSYKDFFYTSNDKLALTSTKPYLIERLEYVDSFIIPDVTTTNEFDALLDNQPTAAVFDTQLIANSITQEANNSFNPDINHSLPLLAHWNSGDIGFDEGMTPDYVISLIEEGKHILPSWRLEPYWTTPLADTYYQASILRAKELNLPLTFIIDPLENAFIDDSYYFSLDSNTNPNVIDSNSNIIPKISPFASNDLWSEIATKYANNALLERIQGWYPNPPLVMFVDNKNANKLSWNEINTSKRYIDRYGSNENDTFKRTLIGAQWIEKYRLLHEGFKNNFVSDSWKSNTKFIAYNSESLDIGNSDTWHNDSTITNHYFSAWPQTSDATNVEYVTDGTLESLNNIIFNVNNLNFLLKEAHKSNNDYTHQISISDNNTYQTLDAYRGFSQLALWMVRPSIIREFTHESNDKTVILPKYQAIIDSVELIHNDAILQKFWREGKLVENNNTKIQQSINVPLVYEESSIWYLLDVDTNPVGPWTTSSDIPVYAIALETGVTPNREWLVYAQSKEGNLENITISIPKYQDVLLNASKDGNFYIIGESSIEQIIAVDSNNYDPNASIYLEDINIPEYDATNNAHVLITPTNGNWKASILNDPEKHHFYIEAGDYLSYKMTLTASGIRDHKKTLSLYRSLAPTDDTHPSKLLDSEQASVNITFSGASYWVFDRLSNINDTSDPSFLFDNISTNNILNRLHLKNYYTGIIIMPYCDNNTIQNSYLNHMSHDGRFHDRVGIALANAGLENSLTFGTKIINNDIRNALDGVQLIFSSGVYNPPSFNGTVIDSNRIWVDSDIYTNGDWATNGYNPLGEYMIAENAMDIKAGSNDINNPVVITNNIMYGYREVDTTVNGYLSEGSGTAFVTHYGTENVIFEKNTVYDSQSIFIAASRKDAKPFSIANWSIKNNIFSDINLINPLDKKTYAMYIYYGKNIEVENNVFNNIQQNSLGDGYFFRFEDVLSGCTFKDNVATDVHGTSNWYNHDDSTLNDGVSIIDIDNNYFYGSTETMQGLNTHTFTTVDEAMMDSLSLYNVLIEKENSIILDIKTTELSPHANILIMP